MALGPDHVAVVEGEVLGPVEHVEVQRLDEVVGEGGVLGANQATHADFQTLFACEKEFLFINSK